MVEIFSKVSTVWLAIRTGSRCDLMKAIKIRIISLFDNLKKGSILLLVIIIKSFRKRILLLVEKGGNMPNFYVEDGAVSNVLPLETGTVQRNRKGMGQDLSFFISDNVVVYPVSFF